MHISSSDERDKIDEIDDPFDLYSEYKEVPVKRSAKLGS
jgi:hypothetical protein